MSIWAIRRATSGQTSNAAGRFTRRHCGLARTGLPRAIPEWMLATSITRSDAWSSLRRIDSAEVSAVDDFALTPAERALFVALNRRGVPFIIIGLGAAVLQGAPVATQDLDIWFSRVEDEAIRQAATDAGGFWVSGFGMQPPAFGGDDLSRIDVVLTAHGLDAFAVEYAKAIEREIEGITLRVLPLDRVIASKRATGRLKDAAVLPALEATLLARDDEPDKKS
jgi:hypothetical protein